MAAKDPAAPPLVDTNELQQKRSSNASGQTRRPPQWSLEGLLIVVSVALGFGLAQFGEYRSNRELMSRALTSLVAEVEQNASILEPFVPIHSKWVEALAASGQGSGASALDTYFATRPQMPPGARSPFPFLRRSAWDAALSSGALRLLDYEIAAVLSEIYRLQETADENVDRLAQGPLAAVATYDPAHRAPAIRLLWLTLADIQSAEAALMDLYRQHLPSLRAAAGSDSGTRLP